MPGPDSPPTPPPEVPEEFAAAYRTAYERALGTTRADRPVVPASEDVSGSVDRPAGVAGPARLWLARRREERWFLPAVFAASALALVAAAYGVGSALSDSQESTRTSASAPARSAGSPGSGGSPKGWPGPVTPVRIGAIAADCTAPPAQDSAGHPVDYVPENAIDGRPSTAWRCPGTAIGQRLVLRLGGAVEVAEVGLIPGYAKTDPASGADRYAENNRITAVRWTLGNGEQVVQRLDPDPSSRAVQVLRVPRSTTDTVTVEILAVDRGPRNTTAISTLRIWSAR